jgi:uncharacterized protein YgbK (DUF1537 family)
MREAPPGAGLRFGIFADDLTGALDAAAPFVARGLSAYASLTADLPVDFALRGTAVASVNMDSRRLSADHAAQRAYAAVSDLVDAGYRPAFNKVDSTLRGHTGLEALVATRAGAGRGFLLSPAFPANGRTVIDRQVYLNGEPVHRTDVGKDPLTPVASSDLAEVLRANCRMEPAHIDLATLRRGLGEVSRLLDLSAKQGSIAVVADAETDGDLAILADVGLLKEPQWLLAGSAGLATAIASRVAPHTAPSGVQDPPSWPVPGPCLIVVGSQHKVASEAANHLARTYGVHLEPLTASRLLVRGTAMREIRRVAGVAARHLKAGKSMVVLLDADGVIERLAEAGSAISAARDTLVEGVGLLVSSIFERVRPGALVIVGGDTSLGVLSRLGAAGIILRAEPLPGVPAGVLDGGDQSGIPVVTKAGAFGDRETLARILRYLQADEVKG